MPLSQKWNIENTVYSPIQTTGQSESIQVNICDDIKSDYFVKKSIAKGTEKEFFKTLGKKCKASEASSFAYVVMDNKVIRYYYKSIKINSLLFVDNQRLIVNDILNDSYICRNRNKEIFRISKSNEIKVIRY